ncbi:hypothetical protein SDJN03_01801, partial [Cucurbita argyrosperma subsp. sororia]
MLAVNPLAIMIDLDVKEVNPLPPSWYAWIGEQYLGLALYLLGEVIDGYGKLWDGGCRRGEIEEKESKSGCQGEWSLSDVGSCNAELEVTVVHVRSGVVIVTLLPFVFPNYATTPS